MQQDANATGKRVRGNGRRDTAENVERTRDVDGEEDGREAGGFSGAGCGAGGSKGRSRGGSGTSSGAGRGVGDVQRGEGEPDDSRRGCRGKGRGGMN